MVEPILEKLTREELIQHVVGCVRAEDVCIIEREFLYRVLCRNGQPCMRQLGAFLAELTQRGVAHDAGLFDFNFRKPYR